jgi:siroheme synthase
VAVVQSATLPEQRNYVSVVGQLSQLIQSHQIESPSILVIGEVAKLADLAVLTDQLLQEKKLSHISR